VLTAGAKGLVRWALTGGTWTALASVPAAQPLTSLALAPGAGGPPQILALAPSGVLRWEAHTLVPLDPIALQGVSCLGAAGDLVLAGDTRGRIAAPPALQAGGAGSSDVPLWIGHSQRVTRLVSSGPRVVSLADDGTLRAWEWEPPEPAETPSEPAPAAAARTSRAAPRNPLSAATSPLPAIEETE